MNTFIKAMPEVESRTQGQEQKKNPKPRPRTAFLRTDPFEAKDRNARGQGQEPRTLALVFSKKRKKSSKFFSGHLQFNWLTQNF